MKFDNKKHLLNFQEMDSTHREFVDIYNSKTGEDIQDYKIVMTKILQHSKIHFCNEEELMLKYKYPRLREHGDEHKKVLYEMEYFLKGSDTRMGKEILKSYYNEGLPNWFDTHLLSMDSDLSSFLSTKNL